MWPSAVLLSLVLGATAQVEPAQFTPNPKIGNPTGAAKDSPHFRIYNATDTQAAATIKELEAAYACFVGKLGWRSPGLSYNTASNTGPWYKTNIIGVNTLGSAAGQMFSDARSGLSYLKVLKRSLTDPKVTVHEYGHSLTYVERTWVDMKRTGAWWETVAQFVADTYMTSPLCAAARAKYAQPEGRTLIDLNKVLGSSHQVLVDASKGSGNYYQAWPFLTYLTNNPDGFSGLGTPAMREMFRQYAKRSNETPLHALQRVAGKNVTVQQIVGQYWARMAYVDIGHTQGQKMFATARARINFNSLDAAGTSKYRVKAARQPKYMGANLVPLKTSGGALSVSVSAAAPFTATLAVRAKSGGKVRYVALPKGAGKTTVEAGEEASLVVANTPASLHMYDGFSITGDVARGLNYQVEIQGARV
jgi:hypothetical protein